MKLICVLSFCVLFTSKLTDAVDTFNEDIQFSLNNDKMKLLSRRRRYLTFPEGSSLQLVYDQTIPIVALPLLFTVGVTVAMAWELPSMPVWEITKEIRDQIASGGLSRIDNDFNTTNLIDTHDNGTFNNINHHNYYYTPEVDGTKVNKSNYGYNSNKYYYTNSNSNNFNALKGNKPYQSNKIKYYANNHYNDKNYYTNSAPRPSNNFASLPNWSNGNWKNIINRVSTQLDKKYPLKFNNQKHKIYPVFGKRSIASNAEREMMVEKLLDDEERRFHLEHHRSTRNVLYSRIEKYLHSKGKNGNACVLRALCETGQKNRSKINQPESFLIEIMKAVFSLPAAAEASEEGGKSSDSNSSYEEAHNTSENCTEIYPACKDSIWSSDFIF